MKTIDILMATYNGEEYVEEQIRSILNQTYSDFNLIISDDNSQDMTLAKIRKLAALDSRIKLIENSENIGYIKNFEKLIMLSDAEIIMISDQDDYWLEDKIEQTYKFFEETNSDLVYTDLKVVDRQLNIIHESFNQFMKINPSRIKNYKDTLHRNFATGNTFLFSAKMKKFILPFIELKLHEFIHDWYIWIECMFNGQVNYLDKSLVLYRQHDANQIGAKNNSTSNSKFIDFKKKREKYIQIHIEFASTLREKHPELQEYFEYLNTLEKTKYINFRFLKFNKYFKSESFFQRFKFLTVLHFPIIFFFVPK